MPELAQIDGDWTNPITWSRRRSLAVFINNLLPDFMVAVRTMLELQLPDTDRGVATADVLFTALGRDSDCSELVDAATRGLQLPAESTDAINLVQGILEAAFVGDTDELDFLRYALAEFWTAWWRVPQARPAPQGACWMACAIMACSC